ncbi:hypothetical protein INR49_005536 [Caranx melampygus]|nr:hypothetical protein INR49_005536 [Caranx melampygus]
MAPSWRSSSVAMSSTPLMLLWCMGCTFCLVGHLPWSRCPNSTNSWRMSPDWDKLGHRSLFNRLTCFDDLSDHRALRGEKEEAERLIKSRSQDAQRSAGRL